MLSNTLILLLTLAGLTAATGGYWLAVVIRIRRVRRYTTYLREGRTMALPETLVSVVVPAHNEARVIERLVRSVREQKDVDLELIVVLDRCTDDTRRILDEAAEGDPRVRVVEIDACPEDWAGKCNAARVGAEHARGEWILFTDADVRIEPTVLRSAVALAIDKGVDLFSAYTTLTAQRWWEKVVQPVAAVTLLRQYPTDRVNDLRKPRSFANGQFMLFKAETYRAIGGHETVKDDLLEDIAFARKVHAADGSVNVVAADGMIVTSMYASLDAMLEGWKRIFIETSRRNPAKLRQVSLRVLASGAGSFLGPISMIAGVWTMVEGHWLVGAAVLLPGVFTTVVHAWALLVIFHLSRMPLIGVIGWPLGCLYTAGAIARGASDLARGRPIRWGGRAYLIEPGGGLRPGA